MVDRFLEKATRQHTRDHNSQLILRTIYDAEAISRADLARLTRLTRTTVSDVVATLIERGLVEEIGHGISSGGRQPILLQVVDDSRHLIGINLMNGELTGAIINLRGAICQQTYAKLTSSDAESTLAQFYAMLDELIAMDHAPLLGIGISTPGLMDPSGQIVRRAVNYGWQNLHLKELLEERYRLPVYIGNLAHMSALAEYTYGGSQDRENLVVMHISHGIGAGIILQGQLFHGDAYGAGEIGHVVVAEGGPRCNCGNEGCLESVADTRAIVRRVQELRQAAEPPQFDEIVQSFHAGDPLVQQVIAEVGYYLGIAVAQLVGILNIERIVITGPIAHFGPRLQEIVTQEMQRRSLPMLAQSTEVVVAEEYPDTILLGISALLLNQELGLVRFGQRRSSALQSSILSL